MRSLMLIIIVAAFVGCVAPASTINKLKIGMTEPEVTKIMGPPLSVTADQESKYLNYSLSECAANTVGVPYTVRIVNGKVASYGRDGTGGQSGPHPVVTPVIIH